MDSFNINKIDYSYDFMENDEEIWDQVLDEPENFSEYITPENKELNVLEQGIFYKTFTGGPEGGLVILPNGDIYEVSRDWGEPYKIDKKHYYKKIKLRTDRHQNKYVIMIEA